MAQLGGEARPLLLGTPRAALRRLHPNSERGRLCFQQAAQVLGGTLLAHRQRRTAVCICNLCLYASFVK